MNTWIVAGLVVATIVALFGGYMLYFWPGSGGKRLAAPKRDMRTTWKVVQLSGPLPEGLSERVKYGVIISSDEMLAQAQTLLFCPLINGVDEVSGAPLAILPWHVPVEIRQDAGKHLAELGFERKYVSTKIVLPIGHNEIDQDGLERGYLDDHSRIAVAKKLSLWMPPFLKIAHS